MEHAQTLRALAASLSEDIAVARMEAHAAFDPLWQHGSMTRSAAYRWLSRQMSIPKGDCHMGRFTVDQCRRVVDLCKMMTA